MKNQCPEVTRQKNLKILATVCILASSVSALGAPTYYPNAENKLSQIVNPTNSTLLGDTKDADTIYVMPPITGKATPSKFEAANANMGFCQEMADLQLYSRQLSKQAAEAAKKAEQAEVKASKAAEAWADAEGEVAVLAQGDVIRQLRDNDSRIETIETRLDGLYERLNGCQGDVCDSINDEIVQLISEKKEITKNSNEIKNSHKTEAQQYAKARGKADGAKKKYELIAQEVTAAVGRLIVIKEQFHSAYANLAKLEGGFVDVNYDTGWESNVIKLRTVNPGFNMQMIPTEKAVMNANFVGATSQDSYLASLPILLDYTVNGEKYQPWATNAEKTMSAFPGKVVANMRLSLTGACVLAHPEKYDLEKGSTGFPVFGMAVNYEYPANFRMKVRFSYNLYKFYEIMQSSGSSGGFFSSHSWTSVSETNISRDAFKVAWEEEDPANSIPEDQKRKIESEIKTELIERVLKQMARPDAASQVQMAGAPAVPEHGSLVIASGLEQTCGYTSYYCAAGVWILRGLDSIFGSSSSSSNFRSVNDHTAVEEWSESQVRMKPATSVFSTK